MALARLTPTSTSMRASLAVPPSVRVPRLCVRMTKSCATSCTRRNTRARASLKTLLPTTSLDELDCGTKKNARVLTQSRAYYIRRRDMDAKTVRKINLIDVLEEQYPECPAIPRECVWWWTEDDVRAWFCSNGTKTPNVNLDDAFKRWFPGLDRSQTRVDGGKTPKLRVLCFANAGNTEDMYTSEGTGPRRAVSPLLEWCKQNGAEMLAVQLPGRANRRDESYIFEIRKVAEELLQIVASTLADVPYVCIGHYMGTWVAFELLLALRAVGIQMPRQVFFSAFPFPDIPHKSRPWRVNALLDDETFKYECRRWDVNELIFGPMWNIYHPLMRSDFHLFDKYDYVHIDEDNFDFPLTTFYATGDKMITREMVEGWEMHTAGAFELIEIAGNHLFPLQKEPKGEWLQMIVDRLGKLAL